jgi:hypothetical protein
MKVKHKQYTRDTKNQKQKESDPPHAPRMPKFYPVERYSGRVQMQKNIGQDHPDTVF